jgi:catechol 2,3-dioxygenase-like lactoylglutathione lyase family enzyme
MTDGDAAPASRSRAEFSSPQVNLYAGDIDASLRFYHDVLGLSERFRAPREGSPDHVELGLGAFRLGIATWDSVRRVHGIPSGPGPARVEIALFTDDVDGAYGWATTRGAPSVAVPHDFGGYLRSARIADPDGNPVVFTTRLPVNGVAHPDVRPEFRTHLVNFYVADLERSLGFYRDLVGFRETFRTPREGAPDHVELELEPLNLGLSTIEALRRHHGLAGGGGPPRGEVVLWVADVDAAHAWMVDRGMRSLSPPHEFAAALRGAWVADPDDNPVQLVARSAPTSGT